MPGGSVAAEARAIGTGGASEGAPPPPREEKPSEEAGAARGGLLRRGSPFPAGRGRQGERRVPVWRSGRGALPEADRRPIHPAAWPGSRRHAYAAAS